MKGYKALFPIIMIACMVLSVYMLNDSRTAIIKEYNNYLAVAREHAAEGEMVDAVTNYTNALSIDNTLEVCLEVGNFYLEMNESESATGWGERVVEQYPNAIEAYEFLLQRYIDNVDYNRAYTLYDTITKKELSSETITKLMGEIKYEFYYGEAYDDVSVFSNGYCPVMYEGYWGLANEIGVKVTPIQFASLGSFIEGLAPASTDAGEAYFIDSEGNKKLVVKLSDDVYPVSLMPTVGEIFGAYDGTSWAYYNTENKKLSDDYDKVTILANSLAAVQKDDQWTLVNSEFKAINDKKYIEIVIDEHGLVCRYDRLFVNESGKYYMIDPTGKKIGNEEYINAKLFMDDTYAAVETEKGWTFIDVNGKQVFKDLYFSDARSFMNGFAAVKMNDRWGFIDTNGNVVIECQFEDAKDFNSKGCAFTKNEDIWTMIRLYSLNYES